MQIAQNLDRLAGGRRVPQKVFDWGEPYERQAWVRRIFNDSADVAKRINRASEERRFIHGHKARKPQVPGLDLEPLVVFIGDPEECHVEVSSDLDKGSCESP